LKKEDDKIEPKLVVELPKKKARKEVKSKYASKNPFDDLQDL
jgi:hypothetical protein